MRLEEVDLLLLAVYVVKKVKSGVVSQEWLLLAVISSDGEGLLVGAY